MKYQPVKVIWTSRPAVLLERGEEVSVVQWQDTKSTQAICNDQIGDAMDFKKLTRNELLEQFNEMVGSAVDLNLNGFKVIKQFKDTATGIRRCQELHEAIQKAKKPQKAEKAPSERKARQSSLPIDGKISIIVTENPKRGRAKEKFAMYKEGMLVSTYLEKFDDPAYAIATVKWDIKHNFIKVTT